MIEVTEPVSRQSSGMGAASADHRPRSFWVGLAGSAALLLVGIASVIGMGPTGPKGTSAPADAFSAARAMPHISAVAQDPRPVGSAEHGEARAYLLDQLESLGWRTEVQESVGMTDFGVAGTQEMAAVANVIATKPGTASTGTVILTGHYDTVVGAPGAADDGIAIGVLLETARALGTGGPNRNTVMILLTDAEEVGLHGAEAFVRERAQELGTAVVLNHEASGAGGAPMTFRMSSPNGELLDVLAGAPGVSADSGSEAAFATLSHDTDFTPFEQGGLYGFDTAIMADGAYYHSPLDDPAHLSAASLQQMGDTTLALTRELSGMDLGVIADGGEQIVLTLPWGLLRYPQSLGDPAGDRCPGPRGRAGVGVAAARGADATARRPVGRRLGGSARGCRRRRVRGVAVGAADRSGAGLGRARAALPAPLLPVGDAARRTVGRRLGIRAAPSAAGCGQPGGRHAHPARPGRRTARGHVARPLRGGGAADASS